MSLSVIDIIAKGWPDRAISCRSYRPRAKSQRPSAGRTYASQYSIAPRKRLHRRTAGNSSRVPSPSARDLRAMNPDAATLWRGPRWGLAVLLACLGMLGPFSIDTYLPAFTGIARSIGAT